MPAVVHRSWQSGQFLAPAPVYLDASVTVGWLLSGDQLHARATSFVGDHLAAGRELQVSLLGVDETIFRLLRGLVASATGARPRAIQLGRELKKNPKLLSTFLPNIRQAIGYLTSWATLVDGAGATPHQILDSWLDRCGDVGGLHDAYHLGLAQYAGSKSFATGDADYKGLATLPTPLQIIQL